MVLLQHDQKYKLQLVIEVLYRHESLENRAVIGAEGRSQVNTHA